MNVKILAMLFILRIEVSPYEMRMPLTRRLISTMLPKNLALQKYVVALQTTCNPNNGLTCPSTTVDITSSNLMMSRDAAQNVREQLNAASEAQRPDFSLTRRMLNPSSNFNRIITPLLGKLDGYISKEYPASVSNILNMKLDILPTKQTQGSVTESNSDVSPSDVSGGLDLVVKKFANSLDELERKFFAITFNKLALLAPPTRQENGMSFVQSGLFLQLALMALATEVQPETRREIDDSLGVHFTDQQTANLIDETLSSLPESSEDLKFRWSTRLVLRSQAISDQFRTGVAQALRLKIDHFNGSETPKEMTDSLNHMVEEDSGGAIHNTFDEDELSGEVRAALVNTLYLRARWRSAPTLLNGSKVFRDSEGAPRRAARMIRLNDVMMYADLPHWGAEALEIPYSRPGLSLLLLIPRGTSLRHLVSAVGNSSLSDVTSRMRAVRVAATLPLYTLRMTLLLPNKLQALNISRLVEPGGGGGGGGELRLSLAVQRIMFWAEAGRNAFKDDGIEWDESPQLEIMVDRPYIFYVRWKNKTLMNGNFVL